jgi:hypothetical protein
MNNKLDRSQKIKDIIYNADGINIIFEGDKEQDKEGDEEKEEDIVHQFPKIIIKKKDNNVNDKVDNKLYDKLDDNINNTNIYINMSIKDMIEIMHR